MNWQATVSNVDAWSLRANWKRSDGSCLWAWGRLERMRPSPYNLKCLTRIYAWNNKWAYATDGVLVVCHPVYSLCLQMPQNDLGGCLRLPIRYSLWTPIRMFPNDLHLKQPLLSGFHALTSPGGVPITVWGRRQMRGECHWVDWIVVFPSRGYGNNLLVLGTYNPPLHGIQASNSVIPFANSH